MDDFQQKSEAEPPIFVESHLQELRRGNRLVHYLTNLPTSGIVSRPERPVGVAGDDAPVIGGLYVPVEGVFRWYVVEVRATARVYGPLLGEHDYLAQLRPRDIVASPERAILVTRNYAVVVGRL